LSENDPPDPSPEVEPSGVELAFAPVIEGIRNSLNEQWALISKGFTDQFRNELNKIASIYGSQFAEQWGVASGDYTSQINKLTGIFAAARPVGGAASSTRPDPETIARQQASIVGTSIDDFLSPLPGQLKVAFQEVADLLKESLLDEAGAAQRHREVVPPVVKVKGKEPDNKSMDEK
jgi:hypothetical protein